MGFHSGAASAIFDAVLIAVTGTHGFIGSALVRSLDAARHTVTPVLRGPPDPRGGARWLPDGPCDLSALSGHDALVHLAGENVGRGRWNAARMAAIRSSRIEGTRRLVEGLLRLKEPPRALIAASAVGYYGDRGDEPLTEDSGPGSGFLASLAVEWERALEPARDAGIRVVAFRFGIVLDPAGGALRRMLVPFRLGLGGVLGGGEQYMSWVDLADAVRAIEFAAARNDLAGPANLTAPIPVTNREFTATLARVLHRPAVLPVPAAALRLAFGAEMARELLLGGARVLPARLQSAGFDFLHPTLEAALRALLAGE